MHGFVHRMREETPNDPKLRDSGARRAGCRGRSAGAASVTCVAVLCSAWLGVFGGNSVNLIEKLSENFARLGVGSVESVRELLSPIRFLGFGKRVVTDAGISSPCGLEFLSVGSAEKWSESGDGISEWGNALSVQRSEVLAVGEIGEEAKAKTGNGGGAALPVEFARIPDTDKSADKTADGRADKWLDDTWYVIAGFAQWILFPLGAAAGIWLEDIWSRWINMRRWRKRG